MWNSRPWLRHNCSMSVHMREVGYLTIARTLGAYQYGVQTSFVVFPAVIMRILHVHYMNLQIVTSIRTSFQSFTHSPSIYLSTQPRKSKPVSNISKYVKRYYQEFTWHPLLNFTSIGSKANTSFQSFMRSSSMLTQKFQTWLH